MTWCDLLSGDHSTGNSFHSVHQCQNNKFSSNLAFMIHDLNNFLQALYTIFNPFWGSISTLVHIHIPWSSNHRTEEISEVDSKYVSHGTIDTHKQSTLAQLAAGFAENFSERKIFLRKIERNRKNNQKTFLFMSETNN